MTNGHILKGAIFMESFGKKVVQLRIPVLIVSLALLVPSFFGYVGTRVNYDILSYLPKDIGRIFWLTNLEREPFPCWLWRAWNPRMLRN